MPNQGWGHPWCKAGARSAGDWAALIMELNNIWQGGHPHRMNAGASTSASLAQRARACVGILALGIEPGRPSYPPRVNRRGFSAILGKEHAKNPGV